MQIRTYALVGSVTIPLPRTALQQERIVQAMKLAESVGARVDSLRAWMQTPEFDEPTWEDLIFLAVNKLQHFRARWTKGVFSVERLVLQ